MMPEMIVLVDEKGQPIGEAEKAASHHANTPRHLAFSCYIFDNEGRILVTKRAEQKKVWPGVWTNSVCGHPAPGEDMIAAIMRRLDEELGMAATDFVAVLPKYSYTTKPFNGIVENEFCPVHVARAMSRPMPNPLEVQDIAWKSWSDFVQDALGDQDDKYSWWCKDQLGLLKDHPIVLDYCRPVENDT